MTAPESSELTLPTHQRHPWPQTRRPEAAGQIKATRPKLVPRRSASIGRRGSGLLMRRARLEAVRAHHLGSPPCEPSADSPSAGSARRASRGAPPWPRGPAPTRASRHSLPSSSRCPTEAKAIGCLGRSGGEASELSPTETAAFVQTNKAATTRLQGALNRLEM